MVDPKLITCLVVDECHKAQKQYAYVVVVQRLMQIHHHFRVLGLSATPGQDIESIQSVINNLDINTICLRTREDPDVRKYLKEVLEEEIVVKLNARYQKMIDEWMGFVLSPLMRLNNLGLLPERNPRKVNKMMLLDLQSRIISGKVSGVSGPRRMEALNDIKLLMSMTQASAVLSTYGVGAFVEVWIAQTHHFQTLGVMFQETAVEKPNPAKVQLVTSSKFKEYYNRIFQGVQKMEYVHPKLERLREFLIDHFRRNAAAGRETRVIVFAQYRSSVQEILNFLRGEKMIRATAFVGQQKRNTDVAMVGEDGEPTAEHLYPDEIVPNTAHRTISSYFGGRESLPAVTSVPFIQVNGQSQKQQQEILRDFKAGKFNVLVATCIAEEGLDIGEVDLLVCYEGISSSTRLLQRKGRTGRKRSGRVVMLLTEGAEYQKHRRSLQKYTAITKTLKTRGDLLRFCPHMDTLFTSGFHPECVKESLHISEFHYSQIGGHTPKKRSRTVNHYVMSDERKRRENSWWESAQGKELTSLLLRGTIDVSLAMRKAEGSGEEKENRWGVWLRMKSFIEGEKWKEAYPESLTGTWLLDEKSIHRSVWVGEWVHGIVAELFRKCGESAEPPNDGIAAE